MRIGDLVRYRWHNQRREWLGIIVREIPGNNEVKVIEWVHVSKGTDRGSYKARDLVVVSESR